MWFSTTILGISLAGLVVLFGVKAFELKRNARTPLSRIREAGDPVLTRGWAHARAKSRTLAFTGLRVGILGLRTALHKAETKFDTSIHAIALRLNRYLRTRRLHMRHGSEVSTHLKSVLEKTKKAEESDQR